MRKWFVLALSLMLAGCGGSADSLMDSAQLSQAGGLPSGLSGRVLSPSGAPLNGVRMVLQNRTTRLDAEVVSGADGGFSVPLESGVYDVGLDLEGDSNRATAFYGPVVVGPGGRRDFVLPDSAGRPVGQVFGTIFTQQGVPAGNRRVDVKPGFVAKRDAAGNTGAVRSTFTDAKGGFAVDLGSGAEFGLDIDVFDARGVLDEFIDVGKLQKPLYVEFAVEQSEVVNLLRANESSVDGRQVSGRVAAKALIEKFATGYILLLESEAEADLADGNVPPDTGENLLKDLLNETFEGRYRTPEIENLVNKTHLLVSSKGFLWWKYSVNVDPGIGSEWTFSDATGDKYGLSVIVAPGLISKYHWVSYNSKAPSIVAVKVTTAIR